MLFWELAKHAIVTRQWAGKSRVQLMAGERGFFLLLNVETDS
jgi:hypothetical protein